MKMFLISDNLDTYAGMRLAGVEGTVVKDDDELRDALDKVVKDSEIGILLISEGLCSSNNEQINNIKLILKKPLVVEVPDRTGSNRRADFITSYVNEAIGVRL